MTGTGWERTPVAREAAGGVGGAQARFLLERCGMERELVLIPAIANLYPRGIAREDRIRNPVGVRPSAGRILLRIGKRPHAKVMLTLREVRQLVMFLLDSSEKAEDLWEKFEAAHPDLAESIKKSDRDRRID
jgi:hypothetical protein